MTETDSVATPPGAAEGIWRRGTDGRWPDGHKCGGCPGPYSEQCDCCTGDCECGESPRIAALLGKDGSDG